MHGAGGNIIFKKVTKIDPLRSLIVASLVILLLAVSACTDVSTHPGSVLPAQLSAASANSTIGRVEVFYFHGNQRCASCIAVGDLAETTVNTSFKDELASGRLVFADVNYDLPENAALKTKYNVTGSSLWIGVSNGSAFHMEQDIRVWSLINNKDAYSAYLSGVITKRLNGDLS
jgi:hypothetical protein